MLGRPAWVCTCDPTALPKVLSSGVEPAFQHQEDSCKEILQMLFEIPLSLLTKGNQHILLGTIHFKTRAPPRSFGHKDELSKEKFLHTYPAVVWAWFSMPKTVYIWLVLLEF